MIDRAGDYAKVIYLTNYLSRPITDRNLIKATIEHDIYRFLYSVGAVIGAQFGARLSQKVSGTWIIRLLAVGLALVAIYLLISPL
jgi:uncharacterized membrane protein YfcA